MKVSDLTPAQKQQLFDALVPITGEIALRFTTRTEEAYELMLDIDRTVCIAIGAELGDLEMAA